MFAPHRRAQKVPYCTCSQISRQACTHQRVPIFVVPTDVHKNFASMTFGLNRSISELFFTRLSGICARLKVNGSSIIQCMPRLWWVELQTVIFPPCLVHLAVATKLSQDRELSQGSAGRRGCEHVCVKATYHTNSGSEVSRLPELRLFRLLTECLSHGLLYEP